ncbi:LOW QUALITY PROTEIN: inositol 1,4,5-triphosphate receptor associated 2 [Trichechus inunguis]
MASARKGPGKRHNPVESICRKIRAIQKREAISNPIQQIIKYQSSSFDSPQTNTKKDFEEVLKKMMTAHISTPYSHSSSSEKDDSFISSPQMVSPRTLSVSHLCSPENATYSIILTNSKNISRLRSQSSQNYISLIQKIRKGEFFPNKDLNNFCSENNLSILELDLDFTSDQISECFTPQDLVVKTLFQSEEDWKLGTNDGEANVTYNINKTCEEELLTSVFHACDKKCRGSVGVAKIIDYYVRQTSSQDAEDCSLEKLWNMLDPEKRYPHVDLETFHAIMKEWMTYCRNKWEGLHSGSSSSMENSVFEQQDSIKSGGEFKMTTDITDSTLGSCEAFGRDTSKGVLEMSDLMSCVADLHFNKKKLKEENKFKLTLEALEEANSQLTEDCIELRSQINSTHQAIMRTNLLKEELEELKISMNASEEQKSAIVAQNKQLETENRALFLKIRVLQEENTKNIMDINRLEKKIEELSKTKTEHQMQLHIYESTLLDKDASSQKQDLYIEELKSTIIEYGTIIEILRGDKNKLARELQNLQQELILNRIQLNVNGEHNRIISEGAMSLHYELILAQSAENKEIEWQCNLISLTSWDTMMDQEMLVLLRSEQKGMEFTAMLQKLHEEVSEVETLTDTSLQWITNPEITVKEGSESELNEFKHIVEEKLNICVLMLNSLGNYRESIDKEFVKLIEILKRFKLEYFHFRKEFLSRQKQLETIKQLQEDAVNQEALLRNMLQEGSQWLEDAKEKVKDRDQAAPSAREEAKSLQHKLEEAISEQWNRQTINTEIWDTRQMFEQKTSKLKTAIESRQKKLIKEQFHGLRSQSCGDEEFPHYDPLSCPDIIQQPLQQQLKQCCYKLYSSEETRIQRTPLTLKCVCWYTPLLDALHLDSLTGNPRLGLTLFSYVANRIHASCERPKYAEIKDDALDVTRGQKCPGPTGGPHPGADLSGYFRMTDDVSMKENGAEHLCSENLPQSREYPTLPVPGHTSSTDSTVISSDASSEILNMAAGGLDCRSLCEKEEDTRSASTMIETQGTSLAHDDIPLQGSMSEDKAILNLEAKEEPETMEEHRTECAAGDTAVSPLPVTTVKSVNFRQSDNISANEKEVEAEFLRLSLGFKCDWFTLEKRVKLEERSRDLAEENLKREITNCLKLLESLTPLCEDDNQAQEIIKKLEKGITFLSQCTVRMASRAEMLGAINQESRVSKAVEVMIQHVENLKRMYAKEHAELEELKQVLLQNERSFNPLGDEGDCQIKKRSASLNSKPSSLRRVSIVSLPRNTGNVGTMAGMENNDRFSRRSSSWRILGSKQSEHRPSLCRFISTYSWADAEEEKCEVKTKDNSEPPGEETVERTRKPSLSEKRNDPSKWDGSSIYGTIASWATNLKTSFRKANKALWISAAFTVLFAALMSFLTGLFFQKPVDATPTQSGDSWMSLEHALWPFTRLQHNGPPPV